MVTSGMERRTALGLALACGVATAACDNSPTDATTLRDLSLLPEALAEAYSTDAARLAARWLETVVMSPLPPVEIPPAVRDRYLDDLVAVWALEHPARDSVVERFDVHTFPHPPLREILVGVERDSELAAAWRAGRSPTGVAAADDLVDRYGLEVTRFQESTHTHPWALLRTDRDLNADALALRFRAVPGVAYAESNAVAGDGNDIRVRSEGEATILDYIVGFGDCYAGCIAGHTWTFRVEDGVAEFLGSSGAPLPGS